MKNLSFAPTKENRVHVARRREATKGFWSAGGGASEVSCCEPDI